MLKLVKSLAAIALVAALWTAPDAPASAQSVSTELAADSVLETIKKRGKLRAGVSSFVPWVMRAKDGGLIGFEIDVAKKIAEDMEVEIEFVPTAFSGIIAALVAGEFDIIMTGISMVPKRNLTINFSNPYNWGGIGFVANKKLTGDWKLEQFDSPDVIFTVRRGSNDSIASVRKVAPSAKIRQFDDDAQAQQDVLKRHRSCVRDGRAQADQGGARLPGPDVAADGRYAAAALALGLRRAQGRSRHPQLAEQLDHSQP